MYAYSGLSKRDVWWPSRAQASVAEASAAASSKGSAIFGRALGMVKM